MGEVDKNEQEAQTRFPTELAEFRAWLLEYDWAARTRQLERDVQAGRQDGLAEKALRDHAAGKTTPPLTHRDPPNFCAAYRSLPSHAPNLADQA